jgi:hypothetical protein
MNEPMKGLAMKLTPILVMSLLTLASNASAALPDGWAVADGPAPSEDAALPGCCGFDLSCCKKVNDQPQSTSFATREPVALDLGTLPTVTIAEASPLPADASLQFFDANGRPLSRLDVAPKHGIVQVVPRGEAGRIAVGNADTFWGNSSAFFARERQRGFGVNFPWNAHIPQRIAVQWQSLTPSSDALRFRSVAGTLDRFAGTVDEARGIDTALTRVGDLPVFAARTRRDGHDELLVIMPKSFAGYRDAHVRTDLADAFFFFDNDPFEVVTMPLDARGGSSAGMDLAFSAIERFATFLPDVEGSRERIHLSVTTTGDGAGKLVVATTPTP